MVNIMLIFLYDKESYGHTCFMSLWHFAVIIIFHLGIAISYKTSFNKHCVHIITSQNYFKVDILDMTLSIVVDM